MSSQASHLVDWTSNNLNATVFYMINSQECERLDVGSATRSYTTLNVVWGLVFIVMGVCMILLNLTAIRGLYNTIDMTKDFFRPSLYVNLSLLDIIHGLCAVFSGAIMLSGFTWDESDGGGTFLCNIFGIMFSLALQTKLILISGGLLITVITVMLKLDFKGKPALRTAGAVIIIAWFFGLLQALLPYMYGSKYTQPDYLNMCVGSFTGMTDDEVQSYYSGYLVLLFIPLILGLILSCFTIPGLIAARDTMKVYTWTDSYWGTFTMTSVFVSNFVCHAAFFIVHFAGMWALDDEILIDLCSLNLDDMRYFFSFMIFTIYLAGIAEPLSYLTTNMEAREKLCAIFPVSGDNDPARNRVTPLLVDIRQHVTSAGGVSQGKREDISHI